jgi:hypothetical protein
MLGLGPEGSKRATTWHRRETSLQQAEDQFSIAKICACDLSSLFIKGSPLIKPMSNEVDCNSHYLHNLEIQA